MAFETLQIAGNGDFRIVLSCIYLALKRDLMSGTEIMRSLSFIIGALFKTGWERRLIISLTTIFHSGEGQMMRCFITGLEKFSKRREEIFQLSSIHKSNIGVRFCFYCNHISFPKKFWSPEKIFQQFLLSCDYYFFLLQPSMIV